MNFWTRRHLDDAAYTTKLFLTNDPNLKTIVPQLLRYKRRPSSMVTPDQCEAEVKKIGLPLKVVKAEPGKVYTLTKSDRQSQASEILTREAIHE